MIIDSELKFVKLLIEKYEKGTMDAFECWEKISECVDKSRGNYEELFIRKDKIFISKIEYKGKLPPPTTELN